MQSSTEGEPNGFDIEAWQRQRDMAPLDDDRRKAFEAGLREGRTKITRGPDGRVQFSIQYMEIAGNRFYTPVDLDRGVALADGEVQITNSPLVPAFRQWLGEVAARVQPNPPQRG